MQITLSNPGAACTCVCAGYEILYAVVSCKHNAQQRKRGSRANEEDDIDSSMIETWLVCTVCPMVITVPFE